MFGWDYFSIGWLFNKAKLNSMQKEKESLFSPPQAVSILFRLAGNGWCQKSVSTGCHADPTLSKHNQSKAG